MIKNKIYNARFFFSIILLTGLLVTADVFANIKLPAIFSDKMVLQQKAKVAVWGWADPGEKITITGSWSAKSAKDAH